MSERRVIALFMSAKFRKRHTQCLLDLEPRTWGGKREGAGRKKMKGKHDAPHRKRPALRRYRPVHAVMRVMKGMPKLRQGRTYRAIRKSLVKCLGNDAFRVCHVSIQGTHLHFLVEATDERALSAGMKRLNILVAKAINRELGRRGKVFAHRYHATQITSPKQARHSLAYVLNNWRRHREDETCERAHLASLDPYASGLSFDGWSIGRFAMPADYTPLPVSEPSTWLLRVGWRKHGLIDVREVPGPLTSRQAGSNEVQPDARAARCSAPRR
jgi:REP element-mobilizing transposase RayT